MAICITDPIEKQRYDQLVAVVGKKEAARDYFEQNEMVRPPSVVLQKIKSRSEEVVDTSFSIEDFLERGIVEQESAISTSVPLVLEIAINKRNAEISEEAINDISKRLGIPYSFISEVDAVKKNAGDAKGFYQAGEVYLVKGRFTPDTVFHEFMHPIIKSMAIDNPELFNQLYQDAIENDWAKNIDAIVRDDKDYKNLDESNIRQEIVVQSLTYMNENAVDNRTLLDKFLYHIRQFLRKMLGRKVNVGKLTLNTSLEDLIDMMNMSEEFDLNKDFLKVDDVILFQKDYDAAITDIEKRSLSDIQKMTNEFRGVIKKQIGLMQKERGIYSDLSEDLVNDSNTGLLQEMFKNMKELSSDIGSSKKTLTTPLSDLRVDDSQQILDRTNNFIDVVAKTKVMFKIYEDIISNIGEVEDMNPMQMDQLEAISVLADKWSLYFNKYDTLLATSSYRALFPEGSSMVSNVSELKNTVIRVKEDVDKKRYTAISEVTYRLIKDEYAETQKFYEDRLDKLRKKELWREYANTYWEYHGVTIEEQAEIDELEDLKENSPNNKLTPEDDSRLGKLKSKKLTGHEVTREGVQSLLENRGPDAKMLNSYMEGYMISQDKVVQGFFSFMFDKMKEVNFNANTAETRFRDGLKPLLAKTTLDYVRHVGTGRIGKILGRKVNVGKKIVTGTVDNLNEQSLKPEVDAIEEVSDWMEWQFLSNFQGQDRDILELEFKISKAQKAWNHSQTDKNEAAYYAAIAEYDQFQIDFMNQDMVPEFYKAEHLLKDEVGVKAKRAREIFFEELNQMKEVVSNSMVVPEAMDAVKKKWREYRYLYSLTDEKGVKKTGDDLAIAERLMEYRDQTRDFYKWEDEPDKFQDALDAFISTLENEGLTAKDTQYQNRIDQWKEHNTAVEVVENYYTLRQNALEEKSQLLKPLMDINAAIIDTAPLYKEIYNETSKSRDEQGQPDGSVMTAEVQIKVRDLHIQIEEARYMLYTSLGLTRGELDEYTTMVNFHTLYERYETANDEKKVQDYQRRMGEGLTAAPFNISKKDVARILQLDKILSGLTRTNATRSYINTIESLLDAEESVDSFDEFLDDLGVDRAQGDIITEANIDALLNPIYSEHLKKLLDENADFNTWFKNNHYLAERMVPDEDGKKSVQEIYVKTAFWSYSSPTSHEFYKGFPLKDSAGNVSGLLMHKGLPRVPNMEYKTRSVKEEYLTERRERDRVDEKGNLILANVDMRSGKWLPLTMEEGAKNADYINPEYMNMFHNDRDLWNVLQYVKENHLDNQKTMEKGQRLGLAFPKTRIEGFESNTTRGNFYRAGEKSVAQGISKGRFLESFRRLYRTEADDIEFGFSSISSSSEMDRYETLTRPVTGTYDLHSDEVSTNIFGTMHDYAYSVELFKSLRKINSYSQGLKNMLDEFSMPAEIRHLKRNSKDLQTATSDEKVSNRARAISNIIDQYFAGAEIAGKNFKGKKLIAQTLNHIMGKNAQKWFSHNLQASLTNAETAKLQMAQKTVDKRFPNNVNLAVGEYKSTIVMAQLMRHTYSSKQKPVQLQLLNVMDAIPDRAKQNIGETASRNIMQDVFSGQTGYISRVNMQNQVSVQGFYGMLDKSKYKFKINNQGNKVSLDQAIHLVNGRIETKPGVPQEFSITYNEKDEVVLGDKVKEIIRMNNGYALKVIGMAGKMSEAEFLARSLMGKYIFSLFKFFPAMVMDRYGVRGKFTDILRGRARRRFNGYTRSVEYGRVVGSFDLLRQAFNTGFRDVNYQEVSDALQMVIWFAIRSVLMYIMYNLRFNVGEGGDDPDENRSFSGFDPQATQMYEKLYKASNLPKIPGIFNPRRTEGDFDWVDHLKLQGLRLTIRLNRENNTFMPVDWNTGGGMMPIGWGMASLRSPVQGGVMEDYAKFAGLLHTQFFGGKPSDMKQGADTGPYVWKMAKSSKWGKWYSDYRGWTGSLPDPARGIKGESMNK